LPLVTHPTSYRHRRRQRYRRWQRRACPSGWRAWALRAHVSSALYSPSQRLPSLRAPLTPVLAPGVRLPRPRRPARRARSRRTLMGLGRTTRTLTSSKLRTRTEMPARTTREARNAWRRSRRRSAVSRARRVAGWMVASMWGPSRLVLGRVGGVSLGNLGLTWVLEASVSRMCSSVAERRVC
jgi:hypothetical protein